MLNDIGLKYSTGSSWSPYVREGQELGQELLQSHGYQLDKEGKIMLSGEGNPIHPTPTSLMTGPAVHAQSPESDHRSAGEHLESSTKGFQSPNRKSATSRPILNVSLHIAQGINKRS